MIGVGIYLLGAVVAFLLNYRVFRGEVDDVLAMSAFFGIFSWVYVVIIGVTILFEVVVNYMSKPVMRYAADNNIGVKVKNFLDKILFIKD